MIPFLRGAIPSPRHKLAGATPHKIVGATPAQWLWLPTQLSMWLNDVDGDCVAAEEAFAKACGNPGNPELFITDDTVLGWATRNNVLNGTYLTTVLDLMRSDGFRQGGVLYNDGPYTSVDWTNAAALQNAIWKGPVKIGVAADQLQNAVPNPPSNGWFASGFQQDSNEDHCVSLCGYGTIQWLADQLGVIPPMGMDATRPGYGLFTWKSVGIIDVPSMQAITGEAWLRTPTTVTFKW